MQENPDVVTLAVNVVPGLNISISMALPKSISFKDLVLPSNNWSTSSSLINGLKRKMDEILKSQYTSLQIVSIVVDFFLFKVEK